MLSEQPEFHTFLETRPGCLHHSCHRVLSRSYFLAIGWNPRLFIFLTPVRRKQNECSYRWIVDVDPLMWWPPEKQLKIEHILDFSLVSSLVFSHRTRSPQKQLLWGWKMRMEVLTGIWWWSVRWRRNDLLRPWRPVVGIGAGVGLASVLWTLMWGCSLLQNLLGPNMKHLSHKVCGLKFSKVNSVVLPMVTWNTVCE